MRLLVWLLVLFGLGLATFRGWFGAFPHFWMPWEFLAAVSAAAYNCFAVFVFVVPHAYFGAMDDFVKGGWKLLVAVVRFLVPIVLFSLIGAHLLPGQSVVHLQWDVRERLVVTTMAFIAMLLGDAITFSRLRMGVSSALPAQRDMWRNEIKTLMMFVHLPFIASYIALLVLHHHARDHDPLTIEAFVGGAAAFEVIVQNTIHAAAQVRPHPKL